MDERLIPPGWFERATLDDDALAAAYDALDDSHLARLKGLAARLDACYAPAPARRRSEEGEVSGLLRFRTEISPLDFVCLLLEGEAVSPAQVMAALVPPAVLGVPRLLAAFIDTEPTDAVLAALEVAGVGEVLRVPACRTVPLMRALVAEGRGLTLLLGGACPGGVPLERVESLPLVRPSRAAVLQGGSATFDLEALAWAHPDLNFDIYGGRGPLPSPRFRRCRGGEQALASAGHLVAWLPAEVPAPEAVLTFGPGLEYSWIWPQLVRSRFFTHVHHWTQAPR